MFSHPSRIHKNREVTFNLNFKNSDKFPVLIIPILLGVFLLFLSSPSVASQDQALKEMATDIAKSLPQIEGRVLGIQEGRLLIDKGSRDGIEKGVVLTVFRPGKPYYHPFTGALLGYTEEILGTVQVVVVNPSTSWAVEISVKKPVQPGDKVRITSAKIPLYLFPIVDKSGEGFNVYAFQERFKSYLEETGRFTVYGENHVIMRIKDASELGLWGAFESMVGKTKGLALIGSIDAKNGKYLFEGELLSLETGRRIKRVSMALGSAGWQPQIERDLIFASPALPIKSYGMAMGDVTGDGSQEIVMATKSYLGIYNMNIKTKRLTEISKRPISPVSVLLSLDVADIDGDGRAEIAYSSSDVHTFTVKGQIFKVSPQGKWKKIYSTDNLLRIFRVGGKGLLVEQGVGSSNPYVFSPKVKLWKGRELYSLDFLKDHGLIIGTQVVKLPGMNGLQVLWNSEGRVMLYDLEKGTSIWDLPGIHGNWGRGFFYASPPGKGYYEDVDTIEDKDYERYKEYTVVVSGRSLIIPSKEEWSLAVFKNNPADWIINLGSFTKGEVEILKWKDGYFDSTGWKRQFDGGVVDLSSGTIETEKGKEPVLVVLTTKKSLSRRLKKKDVFYSRVFIYRLP